MIKLTLPVAILLMAPAMALPVSAVETYGPFPVTLKGYEGSKTNSVSYTGQIARHVIHDSLKKLAGRGDGGSNAASLEAEMMSYFKGSDRTKQL